MNRFLVPLGFVAALVIAVTLWMFMPQLIGAQYGDQMQKAGFLVPALIMLLILQISFVVERMLSLRRAQGRGSLPDFLNNVRKALHTGDVDGAIRLCGSLPDFLNNVRKALHTGDVDGAIRLCGLQRGSGANVMRAGLERYSSLRQA